MWRQMSAIAVIDKCKLNSTYPETTSCGMSKKHSFHRKTKKILKFHIGYNAVPYTFSDFLLPCYLATMRESAAFIFKFKLFCGLNSGGKNPEEYDNQSGI